MTQLYSADLSALSKPVKKQRKRKAETLEPSPPPTEPSVKSDHGEEKETLPVPPPTPVAVEPVQSEQPEAKPKKPKTEKQLAALERAREKRRLVKEEQERQRQEEEAHQAALEAAKELKREQQREKRRVAREAKMKELGLDIIPKKGQVVKVSRSRAPYKEDHEPPAWFKKYIESVKTEQSKLSSEKKAQKVIREEAQQEAQVHWEDEPTRQRVTHEVDSHMNRMYSMIFNRR